VTARRGDVLRTPAGELVVVVSRDALNRAGRTLVARVAAGERYRPLPSAVELALGDGVEEPGFVLCHELAPLVEGDRVGTLPPARLAEVERALRYAFDL
jgi:mRNA-degrading endonuclease toxin of MazEF toxin-antitoxin module